MAERTVRWIISQHFAHFFFGEPHHLVKLGGKWVVRADVEATRQVIHRYGAYTGDETTLYAGISSCLHLIEESTQITFAMRFISVAVQAFGIRKDGVGEVVVFVDEEIHFLSGTFAGLIEVVQLLYSPIHLA